MKKVIILFGPSGSGKDTIVKKALKELPYFHKPVSYTTRPKRENERDGVDYHFISNEEFTQKVINGKLIEASLFNNWGYGSAINDYIDDSQGINIIALDEQRTAALLEGSDPRFFSIICFYVKAKEKTRLMRALNREEEPDVQEIVRRFQQDSLDYQPHKLGFPFIELVNETEEDLKNIMDTLENAVKTL